jgi:putative membrane protein
MAGAAALAPLRLSAQSDDDKTFLAFALQADQNMIALSAVAAQKASNAQVKTYAQQIVSEHGDMTATIAPFAPEWGVTPPKGPDAAHQQEIATLNGLSGAAFDRQYMAYMVDDHTTALKRFTSEARFCKDVPFRDAVNTGKDRETAHKSAAEAIQKKL